MMQIKVGRILTVFGAVAMVSGVVGVSSGAWAQVVPGEQLYAQALTSGMPNLEGTWVGRTVPNGKTFFYRTQLKLSNQEGEFIQGTLTWEVSSDSSNLGVYRVNGRIYPTETEEGPGWQLIVESVETIDAVAIGCNLKGATLIYSSAVVGESLRGFHHDGCSYGRNVGPMELTRQ